MEQSGICTDFKAKLKQVVISHFDFVNILFNIPLLKLHEIKEHKHWIIKAFF